MGKDLEKLVDDMDRCSTNMPWRKAIGSGSHAAVS